jgi:hypothetical protein
VNELQLIRAQLDLERRHAQATVNACCAALEGPARGARAAGATLEPFREACVDYLVGVLAAFEERDRRLQSLINQYGAQHPTRDALDEALGRPGRSREALEKLEAALMQPAEGAGRQWQQFAQFFNGPWSERRDAIDALLGAGTRATEWRTVSGIDADSILEERRRFARVEQTLPPKSAAGCPPPQRTG